MKIIFAFAVAMTCAACASQTEMGVRAYASGNYSKAYERWAPAAAAGDAVANYNMGLLWQAGLAPQTPRDPQKAGEFFMRAANLGLPMAMGLAADYALSKSNTDAALTWLNLGARWSDPGSLERLQRLGAPVPSPDLAAAQQQATAAQQQVKATNAYVLGQAIGCAISGGCAGPAPATQPAAQAPSPPITCRAGMLKDYRGNPVYRCK